MASARTTAELLAWVPPVPPAVKYRDTVMSDSPLAYWRLGEVSGQVSVDQMGAHPGFYRNDSSFGTVAGLLTGDTNGAQSMSGGALYSRVEDSTAWNFNSYTLEAWIKTTDLNFPTYGALIAQFPAGGSEGWAMSLYNGKLTFQDSYPGGGSVPFTSKGVLLNDGLRHHVVIRRDPLTAFVDWYVDGVLVGQSPLLNTLTHNISEIVSVGAQAHTNDSFGNVFVGIEDEVAIYNYALPAVTILHHYQVGAGLV